MTRFSPRIRIALLAALLLLVHGVTAALFLMDRSPGTDAAMTGLPLDDAWIHMVYSRSVATGGAPCYNEGRLENGFTSPLWMICGALPHLLDRAFGLPPVTGVKALGISLGWLASLVAAYVVRRAGCGIVASAFGGLSLAVTPALAFSAMSGMEVILAVLLMLSTVAAWRRAASGAGYLGVGILAALATLARPEAGLIATLLCGLILWEGRRDFRRALRDCAWVAVPVAIAAGAWVTYSLAVTGRPLPNTFYAKYSGDGLADPAVLLRIVAEVAGRVPVVLVVAAASLILIAVVSAHRHAGRPMVVLGCVGFGVAFLYAVCATRPMPVGCTQFFFWWRYLAPALPFFLVAAAVGLDALVGGRPLADSSSPAIGPLAGIVPKIVGTAAAATVLVTLALGLGPAAERFAWNCQNINEVQVTLGRWVNANVPAGSAVAVNDAGAIRYFGGRETIDLVGLNRHQAFDEADRDERFPSLRVDVIQGLVARIDRLRRGQGGPAVFDEACRTFDQLVSVLESKAAWLERRGVGYLVVFPSWQPDVDVAAGGWLMHPRGNTPITELMTARFEEVHEAKSDNYTVAEAPPPGLIGQDVMRVYRLVP